MSSVVFQYIIIAALVFAACYSLYRNLRKAFSKSKNGGGCDNDCGCS